MRNFSIQIIAAIGLILTIILATFSSLAPQAMPRLSNPFGNMLSNLVNRYEAAKPTAQSDPAARPEALSSPLVIEPPKPFSAVTVTPVTPSAPDSHDAIPLRWIEPPTPTRWDYPAAARESLSTGRVTLNCSINGSGRPATCRVLSEFPAGMGFGQSAMIVASRAKATIPVSSGRSDLITELVFVPEADTPKGMRQK